MVPGNPQEYRQGSLLMPFYSQPLGILDPMKAFPGLLGYWNSESVVATAAGVISIVRDQSRANLTARNLTPVSTGPTLTPNDPNFNHKPSIGSSTANIRLQSTLGTTFAQPYTCYHTINITAYTGTMFWRSNAGNNINSVGMNISSGPGQIHIQTQDSSLAITSVGSVSLGSAVSCCVYNSGGISGIYLNDSQNPFALSPSQGDLDNLGATVLTVGNFTTANSYSWTSLAIYQGAHDAPTRLTIMKHLGARYGIATT